MGLYLGIDLGGTNIAVGVVDDTHQIIEKRSRPTQAKRSFEEIVADMADAARETLTAVGAKSDDIGYVGIGVPSTVDQKTQRLAFANNLGWKNADLAREFQKNWNGAVRVSNDADCAALGECLAGAGRAYDNVLMLTLGTGVGGGIVLDKKIFYGGDGGGIEPGHSTLVFDGAPCSCGRRGCVEAYCSVTALIRQSIDSMLTHPHSAMWECCKYDLNNVEGRTAFQAAEHGDTAAQEVIAHYTTYLAGAIASMVTLLRPQVVIVGGGVSHAGEALFAPVRRIVPKSIHAHDVLAAPPIVAAQLGNDAGIIGAALQGIS